MCLVLICSFGGCGKNDAVKPKNERIIDVVTENTPDTEKVSVGFFAKSGKIFAANGEKMTSVFLKGVNIGLSEPLTDLSAPDTDYQTYYEWLELIADMGANTVKVFSVMPVSFYHALYDYNTDAKSPLYLLHGIWFNEDYMYSYADAYDDESAVINAFCRAVRETVDIVHGNCDYTMYDGVHPSNYSYDVSKWLVGYVLGLEWDYNFVMNTNTHENKSQFVCKYLNTKPSASPFEAFLCRVGDVLIDFETANYAHQTPIGFLNWATTDPIEHTNEPFEEEDCVSVDSENITATDKYYAGMFAAFDAYPYYPEFLNYQPEYVDYTDESGKNNPYRAYLNDLKKHYSVPLLIAEFGVPSSRGKAHSSTLGYDQGGITEQQQGEYISSMLYDIARADCCGAFVFSWQDEWFKQTWNTVKYSPKTAANRTPNVMSAEQSYGLLGYTPSANITIDGKADDWDLSKPVLSDENADLYTKYDETYMYILVGAKSGAALDNKLIIPIETVSLGSRKNNEYGVSFDRAADFCLIIDGENGTRLMCDAYYNAFDFVYGITKQAVAPDEFSGQKNSGEYRKINQFLSNEIVLPQTKKMIAADYYESGQLKYANSSENSLADFYATDSYIEIQLPWYLLNVLNSKEPTALGDFYNANEICYQKLNSIYIGCGKIKSGTGSDEIKLVNSDFSPVKTVDYKQRLKKSYYSVKDAILALK